VFIGRMLKLKLQYFGHLMQRADSLEKTLMLGINRQELIKHLHTYTETKHHPRASKFQSKTYHANSPATQEHSPDIQYTSCPKSLQTY